MHGQDDDGFLDWLQQRNTYADGMRDGYAGDRIDGDQVAEPEYRRGLSDGRSQRIDEHLQALAEGGDAFAFRRTEP
jgi:hypothetical protein